MSKALARARRSSPPQKAAKVSLTVDADVLREVRKAARRARSTLSAHVSEALARDLRRRRLAELIAEYEADKGVIGERELAEARASWRA